MDSDQYRRLIEAAFPDILVRACEVMGEGWDNVVPRASCPRAERCIERCQRGRTASTQVVASCEPWFPFDAR